MKRFYRCLIFMLFVLLSHISSVSAAAAPFFEEVVGPELQEMPIGPGEDESEIDENVEAEIIRSFEELKIADEVLCIDLATEPFSFYGISFLDALDAMRLACTSKKMSNVFVFDQYSCSLMIWDPKPARFDVLIKEAVRRGELELVKAFVKKGADLKLTYHFIDHGQYGYILAHTYLLNDMKAPQRVRDYLQKHVRQFNPDALEGRDYRRLKTMRSLR